MRQAIGFVLAGVLAAYAFALPEPAAPPGPEFAGPEPPAIGASAIGSVWYCPWLDSGDIRDSAFLLASVPPSAARITLPSPIPNEDPLEEELAITGPGAVAQNLADIVRFGAAPGFVEFDDGPAGVAAAVFSPSSLAGDRCVRSVPKISYLPGGTTRAGRDLTLRLFNPFSELAKVTVSGVSEFGPEPLPDLGLVTDVPGRSWVDIELGSIAHLLDNLLLIVGTEEGLIIPALSLKAVDGDEATWPGTSLSTTWEFPVVATDGLLPELVVANPGPEPILVEVDAFDGLTSQPLIVSEQIAAGEPARIALPSNEGRPYGIRVTAGGPIAAVVVAISPVEGAEPALDGTDNGVDVLAAPVLRVAGTVGAESRSLNWLLPGAGAIEEADETIWVMNGGNEPATITLKPLGVRDLPAEKVVVRPGRTFGFEIPDNSLISGYFVESTAPVSVSWSASDAGGTAFFSGIAISA